MIKETISYTDYEGVQRTEDFWFHLSKAELLELQMSTDGGLEKEINKIIATQDSKKIIKIFKDIIYVSYGEKSADGRRFIKSKEVKDAFVETEAYSELFMKLATDADAANKFIAGIIPADLENKETPATIAVMK